MSAREPLIPIAVVGTARRDLDATALAGLTGADERDGPGPAPALVLLRAAARAAVLDRVSVPDVTGALGPEPPPERLPAPASRHYAGTLTQALGAQRYAAVAESLRTLGDRGLRLPVGVLHRVLEAAIARRELRPLLPRVLGERGHWLARANPRWAFGELLTPDPTDDEVWQVGSRAQRLAWFAALRATDAGTARRLLAAELSTEDAAMRAELLARLRDGLDSDDEPLLEAALTDRGREVRAVARGLLAHLPDSAYVSRMRSRLLARLSIAHGRWSLDLSDLDEADVRDGLVIDRAEKPLGAGAVRLLVGTVPIAAWREDFHTEARFLIGIRDGVLELGPVPGLRDAAIREGDAALAHAILSDPRWPADPELVACLAPELVDDTLARRVQVLPPPKAVPELAVRGFGPETASLLLAWTADSRSFGSRAPVLQALGDHGPIDDADLDLATHLRRLAAALTAADRNRALDAALTLNLRRALAAEAHPPLDKEPPR